MKLLPVYFIAVLFLSGLSGLAQPIQNTSASTSKADSLFTLRDYKNARLLYQKLLAGNAPNSLAWNRFAYSDYSLGNYDAALRSFQTALSFHPIPPLKAVIFVRVARIYARRNDMEKVYAELDSAVKMGYGNIAEFDTLKEFQKIQKEAHYKKIREDIYGLAFPCMKDPHNREFDFWVGDWNVFQSGTTTLVGHNKIERIADGCALLENWTSLNDRTGKSLNFLAPDNTWKQTWVGGGNQEFINGVYKDKAMMFSYQTFDAQGRELAGRFTFFNEKPGQVRQFNETSADKGKTWNVVYDFTYIKKN